MDGASFTILFEDRKADLAICKLDKNLFKEHVHLKSFRLLPGSKQPYIFAGFSNMTLQMSKLAAPPDASAWGSKPSINPEVSFADFPNQDSPDDEINSIKRRIEEQNLIGVDFLLLSSKSTPGNSGGPVVDKHFRVVAFVKGFVSLNSSEPKHYGIGIPIRYVTDALDEQGIEWSK